MDSAFCSSATACLEQLSVLNGKTVFTAEFPTLLIGRNGWHSNKCKLEWRLRFTPSGRFYVQLYVPPTRTQTVGSGLLPTPKAGEGSGRRLTVKDGQVMNLSLKGVKYGVTITQLAEQGFLPTPIASDSSVGAVIGKNDVFRITKGLPRKFNRNGKDGGVGLARLVSLLPLPPDDLNSTSGTANEAGGKKVGKLNPAFVLEMMGFPVNWTLLPFLPEGGMGEINTH